MTKHDTPEFKKIADESTILLGQVGSGLHGVTTGDDDLDLMGVCIEPPEYVIGNAQFEQYLWRSQPEGVRSGAGDTDLCVYSLRKWARLAAQGNPTVLLLMYIPPQEIRSINAFGRDLQAAPDRFLSREVADRFAGYLMGQRERMVGLKSQRTNRPELIEKYGWDVKYGYHMVRLGLQGVELLTTGRIELPMAEPHRTWLTDLRHGKHTKEQALAYAEHLLAQLDYLKLHADLPEHPDRQRIDRWLTDVYTDHWYEKGHL
ncbi:DNA polymerase beta superfamily protein [Nocardia jiangxiensis]|uniref:DNA polymerase beta superfamily protein n=1 Tax=Nocardia jiangxiensis TaxID=282685 RepID=UPI0002D5FC65|nr:nucleotidyltransferase domain-containing protein [Nocardia jiangxiensis]